ncbi:MAG: endonuclease/exonuclease/phosphatase family protein [Planctomycetota bacterium]
MTESNPAQSSHTTRRRLTGWLLGVFAVGLLVVVVMSFFAPWWWVGRVAEYTRFHTMLALALLVLLAVVTRHRTWAGVCLAGVAVNLAALIMLAPATAPVADQGDFRVMHLNVDRNNTQIERVLDAIQNPADGRAPDIVCLQEFTPGLDIAVELILRGYEVVAAIPRDDSRGVAMLRRQDSDLELIEWQELQWLPGENDRPTLAADFGVAGQPEKRLNVLSLHTKRPASPAKSEMQQREFAAAAQWSADLLAPSGENQYLLVLGDFNATPWSVDTRQFVQRSGLLHVGGTFNANPTYPSRLPWPLRVPIDLAAVSPNLAVSESTVGPHVGSDHRPLMVDVSFLSQGNRQSN